MANFLDDVVFPAAGVLKRLATGKSDPGNDQAASQAANDRAKANPSGVDMQAEAAKAAARAKVPAPAPAPAPAPNPANSKDHYTPKGQP